MAPITREKALNNALASSRMEGLPVTNRTREDCLRYLDGRVDAQTLIRELRQQYRLQEKR